jgi:hypothetical protein
VSDNAVVVSAQPTKIQNAFTEAVLVDLAGPGAYARGAAYQHDGRVEFGAVSDDRATAIVRGSVPYDVKLRVANAEPLWTCSCPVGVEGNFCKHCVAVALGLGTSGGTAPVPRVRSRSASRKEVEIRPFVESLAPRELADLVIEQAHGDRRLHERLAARATAARGGAIDLARWRRRIDGAFAPRDSFVAYREAAGWAGAVNEVIDALEELVDAGQAGAAIPLSEHAHRKADDAVQYVDDSDGWLSDISSRLGSLHLRACEQAAPDPIELARRLLDLELTSELGAFHRAANTYGTVLGPTGIAEYLRQVEPRWRKLGLDTDRSTRTSASFPVREAMIGVALASGDPDQLIRVRRHHLHAPDDYREVAEILRAAGRDREAVEWARRGLDAFADRPWQVGPLRELLAEILRARADTSGAVELFWLAFSGHPSLSAYQRLLVEVDRTRDQGEWRQRAMNALRDRAVKHGDDAATVGSFGGVSSAAVTQLIEILLFEGEREEAWTTAVKHGSDRQLWLRLARTREVDHPLEAIPIYEREANAQIDTKNNGGYQAAADHLSRIRRLASAAGDPELFNDLLAGIRTKHKAKRNLMALLERRGW